MSELEPMDSMWRSREWTGEVQSAKGVTLIRVCCRMVGRLLFVRHGTWYGFLPASHPPRVLQQSIRICSAYYRMCWLLSQRHNTVVL